MNKACKIVIVITAIFLLACSNNAEKLILDFEQNSNQITIISFNRIDNAAPFMAKDSLKILTNEFKLQQQTKIEDLNRIKLGRQIKKQEALETLATTSNVQMKKIINKRIQAINSDIDFTNKLIIEYQNHPEQTNLNTLLQAIKTYNKNTDSIIGYSQKVEFIGKEGLLPVKKFERLYYLSLDKKSIHILSKMP